MNQLEAFLIEFLAPIKPTLTLFNLTEMDFFFGFFFTPIFFFVFWRLMAKVVFAPFIGLAEAREAATTGAQDEADAYVREAQERANTLEEALFSARAKAVEQRSRKVSEAAQEAQGILASAENDAKELLKNARAETEQLSKRLREDLFSKSDELVEQTVKALTVVPSPASSKPTQVSR
jgi:F0F1-type ATP synthase membrane subunit b/b'